LPYRGDPRLALQEWLVLHAAAQIHEEQPFDVHSVVAHWNQGPDPELQVEACGQVHLSGSRTVRWDHMAEAIEVWASCGQLGIYPPDLAAILDPEDASRLLWTLA